MRQSLTLFVWLLVLVICAALIATAAAAIFDYIFVPMPYHDPEPPVTLPGN